MLKLRLLEPILFSLLLLLLLILIPNLLLQNNAVNTSLEQGAHSRGLALKKPHAIKSHGSWGAGEIGDFLGELDAKQRG
jgi:hypothetical protein